MAKKETAEEKLLKIIEATKKAKGASSSDAAAVSLVKSSRPRIFITVQQMNMLFAAVVLAALVFFAYQIHNGVSLLSRDVDIAADPAVAPLQNNVSLPQAKSFSYYLDKITARNIFQPYVKKEAGAPASAGATALSARLSKYKLVGVSWLDVPESATVMMEDLATHETRFLREGDKIEDMKVKTIFTDRVVFSCANEEITIKL